MSEEEDIKAIPATRRAYRERNSDGALLVTIEIDEKYKIEFLKMFPEIAMPIAIAPLRRDFEFFK